MVADTSEYGELETGDTKLAFAANSIAKGSTDVPFEAVSSAKAPPPLELGLVTDDVESGFDRAVTAGAVLVKRPEQKPWGQVVGYLRDNNGFLVEICSRMGRLSRQIKHDG
jgi:uncharacterized glyoxalase superfamily protein PhnB